ncbi:unnamed protein product [Clavelina lepadiformis]|uniref:Uncharacterized protein n=1 Tax=Clavelina lepadiformis TaxID=159417 RepID=A0ABP0EZ96_CLALP
MQERKLKYHVFTLIIIIMAVMIATTDGNKTNSTIVDNFQKTDDTLVVNSEKPSANILQLFGTIVCKIFCRRDLTTGNFVPQHCKTYGKWSIGCIICRRFLKCRTGGGGPSPIFLE